MVILCCAIFSSSVSAVSDLGALAGALAAGAAYLLLACAKCYEIFEFSRGEMTYQGLNGHVTPLLAASHLRVGHENRIFEYLNI